MVKLGQVEQYLLDKMRREGAIHMTLIDPERVTPRDALKKAKAAEAGGSTAIMVGGSTAISVSRIDEVVKTIKRQVSVPVILFPSNVTGISQHADAIWFMSLLNSTNPYFITGAQALGAPLVKRYGLEPIPLGYIIIGDGGVAAYIGRAHPISYNKPEVAAIYALAAQYLGMHFVYLEAGSGAKQPVPLEMVASVRGVVDIPLVVGGGIRTSVDAGDIVKAGANVIVTGTLVEEGEALIEETIDELVRSIRRVSKGKGKT